MKIDYAELLADDVTFSAFQKASEDIRNETLNQVFLAIKNGLEKQGVLERKVHASVFISLCESVGGQCLYLPRGDSLFGVIRDIAIFKEFDGKNKKYLAIKYRMSLRSIDNILNDQRKTRRLARDCIERLGVGND